MDSATLLVRGALYEWTWPTQGAGAMARIRGLRPVGRAVTREDVPDMFPKIGGVGIQVLDDLTWIVDCDTTGIAASSLREAGKS